MDVGLLCYRPFADDVDDGWRRCRGNEAPLEIALFVSPANLCQKPFHPLSTHSSSRAENNGDNGFRIITLKLVVIAIPNGLARIFLGWSLAAEAASLNSVVNSVSYGW